MRQRRLVCSAVIVKSLGIWQTFQEDKEKHHTHLLKFQIFWCCVTLEPLNWKTLFQSHIVEQHKSYRMAVESYESIQRNQNAPLLREVVFWALAESIHKNVHCEAHGCLRVMGLKWEKVQELLYLLVFVWSPRSKGWPDRTGMKKQIKMQWFHAQECAHECTSWICNKWTAGLKAQI